MQCPEPLCLARNHPSADRCHECGADLFAVRRSRPMAVARVCFLAGTTSRGVPTPATRLVFFTEPLLMALMLAVATVGRHQAPRSIEDYWSSPDVRVRLFLVWFLIAALGMLFAGAYLFTGETVALVATGSMLVVYWLCGPGEFATAD